MGHDVTPLYPKALHLRTDDPTFTVIARGGGRFDLEGEVSGEPASHLHVRTPSDALQLPLINRSRAPHVVSALRRALPRDVMMRERTTPDGMEIVLHEVLVPAASPPRLRMLTTDVAQRWLQLDDNKVEARGMTRGDCLVTVLCDTRRVTISLGKGTSARAAAARVGASMPHGYRALVEGAVVSVWKDADFFCQVA